MFVYHNENPNGYKIPDCVIRAITGTTGLNYYDVVDLLYRNGEQLNCETLNVKCYEKLLDYDFNLPHYLCGRKTAEQVANDFPYNTLLLRMNGHLSYSVNGVIHDIWDCSNEIITDFWVVK